MPWRSIFQRALYPAWIAASGFALLAMTGPLPIHFSPSSRGTQCRGDPPFNGARYQAWIAASGCALLAMTADRHHREARERANSPLFRCAMQRQPALILRSRIAASRRTRAEMKRTLESLVVRDAAAPLLTMRGPLLIHFSPSSRGTGARQLALVSMCNATVPSPHPEEPHSGVSKDEGGDEAHIGIPRGSRRGCAAPHHEGTSSDPFQSVIARRAATWRSIFIWLSETKMHCRVGLRPPRKGEIYFYSAS